MKSRFIGAALFFCAVFFTPALISAQQPTPPIFFDAFLFDGGGQPAENFNLFFQWEVTGGSVDLVGGSVPGATDQVNGRFVELGGSTNNPGRFATRTAFPFAPGAAYNLRFDYKSSDGGNNSAQVSIGSQVYTVQTSSTELQTFSQNFSFDTLTTANLIFQNLESDTDNSGIGIDNVILSQILSPTAAGVTVSGRVITANGRPIAKARVTMIDGAGSTAVAVSSASGEFEFANVAANALYVFNVSAKGHVFVRQSQAVSVSDNTDNVDFISSTGRIFGAKQSVETTKDQQIN